MIPLWRTVAKVHAGDRRVALFGFLMGRRTCLEFIPRSRPTSCVSSRGTTPWISHTGEGALLLRFGAEIRLDVNRNVLSYMSKLNRTQLEGVEDVLPSYASLLVKFDPLMVSSSEVEQWCLDAPSLGASDERIDNSLDAPQLVSIPVRYGGEDGPDIDAAASVAGLGSAEEVIRLHSEGEYRVYFLGFLGGFPYLGGLPAALGKVPRLETPRPKLPKGTVGIAGGQTGVYTISTPGGWYCIGRTSMKLFDPSKNPPAILRAGDLIKFVRSEKVAVDEEEFERDSNPVSDKPWIEILFPGPLTTVQDLGRHGFARHGVSRSGAADDLALRMGNALLGNKDSAAGLEVTMGGLKIRCLASCAISLTGANCNAKLQRPGEAIPTTLRMNEVILLQGEDEVQLGMPEDGMRTYVCVKGGVDVPLVLGSRSTDVRSTLGGYHGRRLERGDIVGMLSSDAVAETKLLQAIHDPLRSSGKTWELRVLPGPGDPQSNEVAAVDMRLLVDSKFNVLPRADRMAVVISQEGKAEANTAAIKVAQHAHIPYGLSEYRPPELLMGEWMNQRSLTGCQQISEGCVSGTVQLPPDGNPVILLAEHQTTGGYKVPAVVIQADLWQVGQMRPGDSIRFVETSHAGAVKALQQLRDESRETRDLPSGSVAMHSACEQPEPRRQQARPSCLPRLLTRHSKLTLAALRYCWAASGNVVIPDLIRTHASLVERSGPELQRIDLNADCGEGFDDAGLLKHVTSVNIACGAHAGTTESIAEVVRLAAACGAGIGAHVSYVDRERFGRRALDTAPQELFDQVLWQASALDGLCRGAGTRVSYIKPHGALYHTVMAGGEQGRAVFDAAQKLQLPLLLMPQSPWAGYGEGFAERAYDGDQLRSRDEAGAVIHDPDEAARQAVALAVRPNIHSICVHGDSPNAVAVAYAVRGALEKNFTLGRFCSLA